MTTNNLINKGELLSKTQRRYKMVPLPGGDLARIQSLTEREKSEYECSVLSSRSGRAIRSRMASATRALIILCLVDGNGNRLLGDEDHDKLSQVDGAVTAAIYTAASEHCGFSADDIESLVKNSEGAPVEDSPTTSQEQSAE